MNARTESPDLLEAFVRQSRTSPSAVAVDCRGQSVTYEVLLSLANQIAWAIQDGPSGPCPRVLLAIQPSPLAYAGMVGSLMSGGTFCPVDINGAMGRNTAICRQFSPDIVLYETTPPSFLDAAPVTTHLVDVLRLSSNSLDSPAIERSDVAYVVFTSGSTGHPKGVKIGRKSFSYFLEVSRRYFNLNIGERWGQWSNLGHDLGVMDVFMALTYGGTLVALNGAERLRPGAAIRDREIAIWQSVPSVIELMSRAKQLDAEHLAPLRIMSFCGEPLHRHQLEAIFKVRPDLHLFNTYGATETIGFNTLNDLTASNYAESCGSGSVAIGADVPGWSLLLRGGDSDDEGEIVIAGENLSLGYWSDEERTRAAFREVEISPSNVQRCYFTGDCGIRKGSMVFCRGRKDRQVKIRGERIELEEIDGLLREAGFASAHTIVKDDTLYSFVESTEEEVDQERIRKLLAKSLPFHAIPKSVIALPLLPRNQNGKIDREVLARKISP